MGATMSAATEVLISRPCPHAAVAVAMAETDAADAIASEASTKESVTQPWRHSSGKCDNEPPGALSREDLVSPTGADNMLDHNDSIMPPNLRPGGFDCQTLLLCDSCGFG